MVQGRMSEKNKGDGRDVLLNVDELFGVQRLVPADIDEDLDASIQLQQRLRRSRLGLGAQQRREGEHG